MSGIIDVNVWLSRWPGRELPYDQPSALTRRLRELKVAQAWVGSLDMLLHRDLGGVNERLASECAKASDLLVPCGGINLLLPDWEEDVRRCAEVYGMQIIRITPGYHGYELNHERFRILLTQVSERGLLLQIVVRMEDERTQSPLLRARDVEVKPLQEILPEFPKAKVQILNGLHSTGVQNWIQGMLAANVSFDTGTLEGAAGIERLLKKLSPDQLCFGSNFPLFVWEAAELKLRESVLAQPTLEMLKSENALRLIGK